MQTWASFGGNWITSEACLLGQTPYPCTANSICDGPTHTMTLKASIVFLQQDECLFNKGTFYHTEHTNRLMNHKTANWQFDICTNGLLGCSNGVKVKPREKLFRNGSDFGWWVAFILSKWNEWCVVFLVISLSNHESQEFGYSSVGNLWERNCLFLKTISENMSDVLCILECIYRGWWNGYVGVWK